MKNYVTILVIIFFSVQAYAQNQQEKKDKIILKDGSIVYGQLLEYKPNENIRFKLFNNSILLLPDSSISKIEINSQFDKQETYKPKTEGLFTYISVKVLPGKNGNIYRNWYGYSNFSGNGFGADITLGNRFSESILAGVGIGFENYNYGNEAFYIPLYLDIITNLKKGSVSPFLRFQMGYGFVTASNDDITKSKGGLMFNPAFGVKFGKNRNVNYSIDFNFKYQESYFEYFRNKISSTKDIVFRRFSLRFGVLF